MAESPLSKLADLPEVGGKLQAVLDAFLAFSKDATADSTYALFFRSFAELRPDIIDKAAECLSVAPTTDTRAVCLDEMLAAFPIDQKLFARFGMKSTDLAVDREGFLRAVLLRYAEIANTPEKAEHPQELSADRDFVSDEVDSALIADMPVECVGQNVPAMAFLKNGAHVEMQQTIEIFEGVDVNVYNKDASERVEIELEKSVGSNFAMVRVSEGEKLFGCADVCGVVVDEQIKKVKRFALADGVGSCAAPICASRRAVYDSLLKAHPGKPLDENSAATFIQKVADSMTGAFDLEAFAQSIERFAEGLSDSMRRRTHGLAHEVRTNPKSAGATTLLAGFIEDGYLHDVRFGDGGTIVMNSKGDIKKLNFAKADGAPPQINLANKQPINAASVEYSRVPVEAGDRVFVFTDGLLKSPELSDNDSEKLISLIQTLIREGQSDEMICRTLAVSVRGDGPYWRDDLGLIGFTV